MSDAIVKQQPQQQSPSALAPFNPGSFQEAMEMSKFLATSNLIPTAIRGKPADVMLIMMKGRELGLSVMQSLGEIYVVEGRPSASAKLKVGLCLQRPDVCEYFTMVESTDRKATFKTKRRGHPEVTLTYTIEQAQQAGLTNRANWKNHPAAMLRARCESALVDAVYQDISQGMVTPDEAEEIAGDVTRTQFSAPPQQQSGPATMSVAPSAPAASSAPAAKKDDITDAEIVEPTKTAPAVEAKTEEDPFGDPKQPATPDEEHDAIIQALAAAKTEADVKALVVRIKVLPDDLKTRLKAPYGERLAAVKNGAA